MVKMVDRYSNGGDTRSLLGCINGGCWFLELRRYGVAMEPHHGGIYFLAEESGGGFPLAEQPLLDSLQIQLAHRTSYYFHGRGISSGITTLALVSGCNRLLICSSPAPFSPSYFPFTSSFFGI